MRGIKAITKLFRAVLLLSLCAAVVWVVFLRLPRGTLPEQPEPSLSPAPVQTPAAEQEPSAPEPLQAPPPELSAPPLPPVESPARPLYSSGEESMETPLGPLAIFELTLCDGDKVELRNISDSPVKLSDYYLSDKNKDRRLLQLPDLELEPGAFYVAEGLSLSVKGDRIWLSDEEENVLDYARAEQLPVGGSYGRMSGESGWFFFAEPSLGEENRNGFRRVAETPEASVASGTYDDVESITVELRGPGVIRYTTDGNAPDEDSPVYTEPLVLERTTILRASAEEEGALPSRVASFHYFLNEHHSLPIVSFCADMVGSWGGFYWGGLRQGEFSGSVAMYEDGQEVFNQACGLRKKGYSAVADKLKKNIGLYFRGKYGDGALEDCDLFHNGVTRYTSLILRAGQSHWSAVIANELMQELALQCTDRVPCQHNRYCVMYMNGDYRGIYSLKENMNEQFFADIYGVSPESFVNLRRLDDVLYCQELQDDIRFCTENDMSDPELYAQFGEIFDLDNVLDYILLEGFSGNTDLCQNVRFFRSDEYDGRWRFAFFDLDCSFYNYECGMRVVFDQIGKPNQYLRSMANSLIKNPEFRDRLLRRYAEWIDGPLSPENVMREIDLLLAEIEPEIARDRERVGISLDYWKDRIRDLRSFASEDYIRATIDVLCEDLELTPEERIAYFGDR